MRIFIAILSLLSAVALNAQPAVNLYLEPEANGAVFQTIPVSEAESLTPEHPVVDGQPDNDWYRITYPGHYVGFVQTSELNSDGTFNPGARLFIRKNYDSTIVARIQPGDDAKVLDRGRDWSTVMYRGNGHVFYRNPAIYSPTTMAASQAPARATIQPTTSRPAAGSASAAAMSVSTIPVTQSGSAMPSTRSSARSAGTGTSTLPVAQEGGEIIAVDELDEIEPMSAPRPVQQQPVRTAPAQTRPQRPVAPPPGYAPVAPAVSQSALLRREVPRLYEGTFERLSGINFDFFGPSYDFVLKDPSGKRIAYVDIENALLVSPIEAYLNQPVIVEGIPEKIGGSVPILIKAKFIRLTH